MLQDEFHKQEVEISKKGIQITFEVAKLTLQKLVDILKSYLENQNRQSELSSEIADIETVISDFEESKKSTEGTDKGSEKGCQESRYTSRGYDKGRVYPCR